MFSLSRGLFNPGLIAEDAVFYKEKGKEENTIFLFAFFSASLR